MRQLIIADIHNRIHLVDKIISSVEHDSILFLGDFFDSYNDDASAAYLTARWLKMSLRYKNRIHLLGNHDLSYAFLDQAIFTVCPGWNPAKHKRVNEVLDRNDWNKFKFYYRHNNWIFSHAGIHEPYFTHPINGFSLDYFEEECKKAREMLMAGLIHPCFYYGISMGESRMGGLFWIRWSQLEPIKNVNQVVGHTTFAQPAKIYTKNSKNYNLDTDNCHYGIFDGEKLEIFNVL